MERLRAESVEDHDLRGDWDFDGELFEEEAKIHEETRKILELPDLPVQATCVRVPVLVGHLEAVWIETEDELGPDQARAVLAKAPGLRLVDFPSPKQAAGQDEVLVGRIRRDPTTRNGLALMVAGDNLRKGAALNAVQIAELLLERSALAA
jgi:aspartate-semialdehyde dehydrogenase